MSGICNCCCWLCILEPDYSSVLLKFIIYSQTSDLVYYASLEIRTDVFVWKQKHS